MLFSSVNDAFPKCSNIWNTGLINMGIPSLTDCSASDHGFLTWDTWFYPGPCWSWSGSCWWPEDKSTASQMGLCGTTPSSSLWTMEQTWLSALLTEISLNNFLYLGFVLIICTACWAASWTSGDSGLRSCHPPSRGTVPAWKEHKLKQVGGNLKSLIVLA